MSRRILHYRLRWQGLNVSIENAAGSVRKGDTWQTKMKYPYGYIRGTTGHDEEAIDCFVGPDPTAKNVYIVRQKHPNDGTYDEDKCFLNFSSEDAVRKAFLEHRGDDDRALGPITTMTVEEFKKALVDGGGRLHYHKLPGSVLLKENSAKQDNPQDLAQTAVSDLNNRITARIRSAHVDNYKKGLRDQDLYDAMVDDMRDDSDSWLANIASESARSAVAGGRYSAFEELEGEIDRYARSEAMDARTCEPCREGDGMEWNSLDEVDWSPGDDCDGKDNCRGQLMPIFADEGTVTLE